MNYVKPPELREAGVLPLRKQINWFDIGIAVALIIVLGFVLFFFFSNQK